MFLLRIAPPIDDVIYVILLNKLYGKYISVYEKIDKKDEDVEHNVN